MKDERFEIIPQTGKGIYRSDAPDTACVDPTNPDLSTRGRTEAAQPVAGPTVFVVTCRCCR